MGWGVKLEPSLSYDYTTGSDSYYSHSATALLSARCRRNVRVQGSYSLFTDSDYSSLHNGMLRVKAPFTDDIDLSCGLLASGGRLRDSDSRSKSLSLDFQSVKFFENRLEWMSGYRYTTGSFTSSSDQQISVVNQRRVETLIIRQNESTDFRSHSLSTLLGYETMYRPKGLYTDLRLSLTFNSDHSRSASQALETLYGLPHGFYVGASFTLTQGTATPDRNYLGLNLLKSF